LKEEIDISNLKTSISWFLLISLFVISIYISQFGGFFRYGEISWDLTIPLQITAIVFIFLISITFCLVLFSFHSEIKQFDTLRKDKVIYIKSPYKSGILLCFSFSALLVIFLFPENLIFLNLMSSLLGIMIGMNFGVLAINLLLHSRESLLEFVIKKKHYLVLSPNKFPCIGWVKIKDGKVHSRSFIYVFLSIAYSVIIILNLFIGIISNSYSTDLFFSSLYLIIFLLQMSGSFFPSDLFTLREGYVGMQINRIIYPVVIIFIPTCIILISLIILNFYKHRKLEWLLGFVNSFKEKISVVPKS